MRAYYEDAGVTLFLGDCVDVMAQMAPESVDAIVTDPPYGLEFMGKEWDRLQGSVSDGSFKDFKLPSILGSRRNVKCPECHKWIYDWPNARCQCGGVMRYKQREMQAWHHTWALEALRVLKPGGHMVCFGGTRTHHRLWCAVEDAGFEVRDCLMWLYGSGFPKSADVSKAIDKAAGAEKVIGKGRAGKTALGQSSGWNKTYNPHEYNITEPNSPAARQWQGWGTALKPAWEPILLARKPIERTVAHNVQKHGTGALNVDACRIGIDSSDDIHAKNPHTLGTIGAKGIYGDGQPTLYDVPSGRWPANLCLDEEAAAMLDAQSGELKSGDLGPQHTDRGKVLGTYGAYKGRQIAQGFGGDSGGASRFYYTGKAGASERGGTKHPTVKPRDLMLWLCKLITPPNGLILDPFIGSGTTAVAARMGGFRCVGIDNNEEYLSHAAERLRLGDEGLCQVNEARKQGCEQGVLW